MGWPMAAEQAFNSKMLVEGMGVSVELTRGAQGEIEGERVKEMIERVMDHKDGRGIEMRSRAGEVREKIRAAVRDEEGCDDGVGSSVKAMDNFLAFVLNGSQTKEVSESVISL